MEYGWLVLQQDKKADSINLSADQNFSSKEVLKEVQQSHVSQQIGIVSVRNVNSTSQLDYCTIFFTQKQSASVLIFHYRV